MTTWAGQDPLTTSKKQINNDVHQQNGQKIKQTQKILIAQNRALGGKQTGLRARKKDARTGGSIGMLYCSRICLAAKHLATCIGSHDMNTALKNTIVCNVKNHDVYYCGAELVFLTNLAEHF